MKLRFKPLVGAGVAPAGPIELRMDDVSGTFVYDTANSPHTSMNDVGFSFQRAPVTFAEGQVDVKDNGQFQLGVSQLEVTNLRLDEELRRYMPPVMAQFARRLDDLEIPKIKANLGLGWSGKAGESAWCQWDDALVVLDDNKVVDRHRPRPGAHPGAARPASAGSFNGRDLEVHGKLNLDSVSVFGQQITGLTADLDVEDGPGQARPDPGQGPRRRPRRPRHGDARRHAEYSVRLEVKKADLQEYAMNQPGHQGFRGLVNARIDLSGLGYDPHTITGDGTARIVQGDLGTLPVALRFVNVLKPAKDDQDRLRLGRRRLPDPQRRDHARPGPPGRQRLQPRRQGDRSTSGARST